MRITRLLAYGKTRFQPGGRLLSDPAEDLQSADWGAATRATVGTCVATDAGRTIVPSDDAVEDALVSPPIVAMRVRGEGGRETRWWRQAGPRVISAEDPLC